MQVTPLQLAQATALDVNKGVWNRPHLARTVDGTPPVDEHPIPNLVLRDPRDWDQVNHAMQLVMHDLSADRRSGPGRHIDRRQERYGASGGDQAGRAL